MSGACSCEYVDIGVGWQRVTNEPDCPVHSPPIVGDPYADSRPPDGECCCGGCIGMGPCDDELGRRGDECGECALEAQHDGPCAWLCSHCGGKGRCPDCKGTGGYDDVQRCPECDAGCCPYCTDGLVSDE